MSAGMVAALIAGGGYLCGSIPFGYVIGRLVGRIDIRQHGSGNIGATNVGRVLGFRWGLVALALDFLKGWLPVALLPALLAPEGVLRLNLQVLCGVATMIGHMFPLWLGLRGGKGVATGLGVVVFLTPVGSAVAGAAFVLSFAAFRIVSLSSILACTAFAATQLVLLRPAPFSEAHWSLAAFSLAMPALIIIQHRSNLKRLLHGTEPRYHTAVERGKEPDPQGRPAA